MPRKAVLRARKVQGAAPGCGRGMDDAKRNAARAAVGLVEEGMVLGLGTGSTAEIMLAELAARVGEGLKVRGVPTSEATLRLARHLQLPLTSLEEEMRLDLTLDGADEVDPRFDLVKGLGGALLREKVVAACSERVCIMVDEGKLVPQLGTKAPLPVEVARFAWRPVQERLRALGAEPVLRRGPDGNPFLSDNGNHILDARFRGGIADAARLAQQLDEVPGIVEHGLFLGLCTDLAVGTSAGAELRKRPGQG